ncbi:GNAT family N-acetyltransferase [Nostoc flagelliforme FACHB-838]|uniref:GNAT family N-acetyltransferase n=1 Tax=Nostoc flagelliforme FACHB-838 TaxID=2692904 RepID=A0ABR8DHH3_9NOSO|nr:GNAT family N-acetyltransferase [Nostoc flagelliforme]MBD2528177.1 GNAT family N-acetyltransferase [Nostoc flagelliforme FACHB-838]
MDLLVREVQPNDAAAIIGILNPIIETSLYTVFDTPLTVDAEREYILNFPQRGVFHVAVRFPKQTVVGFQTMEPFATFTNAFEHVGIIGTYVDLLYRRQGIGKRLFEATFETARTKGYEKILTYVRADNAPALASYLWHGFRIIGTAQRQAKIKGTYIDEIIIERFL